MTDPVLIERSGDVVTWTLNRPETRNAISEDDMVDAIVAAVDEVTRDETVKVVILTGAGSAFSSGGNLKDMRDKVGMFGGTVDEIREGYRTGIQRITRAVHGCPVPLIAAVNGPAVGAGCDLTLMCDIRIASTSASFAESFVKVGLVPGDGGAWLLPRAVGMARASELAFTGAPLTAELAESWGLVSRVVKPQELMPTAAYVAEHIASNPAAVLRMTKRLLREGQTSTLDEALESAAALQAVAHHSDDHAAAVARLLDKH